MGVTEFTGPAAKKLKGNGQNEGVPNLTHYQRTAKEPNFYEIYKKFKPALSYFNEELVV